MESSFLAEEGLQMWTPHCIDIFDTCLNQVPGRGEGTWNQRWPGDTCPWLSMNYQPRGTEGRESRHRREMCFWLPSVSHIGLVAPEIPWDPHLPLTPHFFLVRSKDWRPFTVVSLGCKGCISRAKHSLSGPETSELPLSQAAVPTQML